MQERNTPSFVIKRPGSFHLEIDTSELGRVLAAAPVPETARSLVVGPHDLHVLNRHRLRHGVTRDRSIPSDYFVMASGDAPHRAMTKLGGVPYLPASVPWPERSGTVGDFYAQINFLDSKDIVPAVPGDVLLVFRFHDLDRTSWDPELYECIWVNVREQELVRAADVRCSNAGAKHPWPAMHGYRVRSYDNPSQIRRLIDAGPTASDLHSAIATKIGGQASDRQSTWGPEVPADWLFLAQVTGVWVATDVPYPVVDRAAPVSPYPDADYQKLMTGPGDGITCLFLDSSGAVRVHFSCA